MKKQFVDAQDSRVTRWLDNFSIFGHLQKGKLSYLVLNICQSRFKILPNTKWTLKNCQRLLKFHQSGENSPNLVTLYQEQQKQQQQFGSLFLLALSQYLFLLPSITIYLPLTLSFSLSYPISLSLCLSVSSSNYLFRLAIYSYVSLYYLLHQSFYVYVSLIYLLLTIFSVWHSISLSFFLMYQSLPLFMSL